MAQKTELLLPLDTSFSRLPIAVITGFLGSGKTTLLNKLVRHPEMQRAAVVVNEFGAIGLDHLLVRSAKEDVIVVEGGCVCCTVRGDLVNTLHDLFLRRVHMEIPEFDKLIIETTGLADPAPIIHTLINDPVLKTYYRLDNVVTTVDSIYGYDQLDEHYETVKQAAVADRLILTKTDIADAAQVARLVSRLQLLNPAALFFKSVEADFNPAQLFSTQLYDPKTKTVDVQQWLQAETYLSASKKPQPVTQEHDRGYHHEHNDVKRHDEHIHSFVVEYDEPIHWKVLNHWFQQLTSLRGKDLLRVKGIAYTVETDLPVVVQGVQHIFQPPSTLPSWHTDIPRTQIVFITRNIKQATIEKMLQLLIHSQGPQDNCVAASLLLLGNQ